MDGLRQKLKKGINIPIFGISFTFVYISLNETKLVLKKC